MVGKKHLTKRRLAIAGLAAAILLPAAALFMQPAAGQIVGQPGSGAENQSGGTLCYQYQVCHNPGGQTCAPPTVSLGNGHGGLREIQPPPVATGAWTDGGIACGSMISPKTGRSVACGLDCLGTYCP